MVGRLSELHTNLKKEVCGETFDGHSIPKALLQQNPKLLGGRVRQNDLNLDHSAYKP